MAKRDLKDIIDEIDFDLAFRRVKQDANNDYLQLPIEIEIFDNFRQENIDFMKSSIKNGSYSTKGVRRMWVPKRNFFLRPCSLPYLEDRILFQALIDKISPILEEQIMPIEKKIVFSHRLNPKSQSENMFLHPKDLWIGFQDQAVNYCEDENVKYVLVSDIASYFENIDLRLLKDTLNSSNIDSLYTDTITRMLSVWANGRTRGLPQMIAPCSFLGNLYLSQVDKTISWSGYKYVRYVDDMRIFLNSEVDQKKALLELTDALRSCYLDVQASKTKFYTSQEHLDNLTLLKKHLIETGIVSPEESAVGSYPYKESTSGSSNSNKERIPLSNLLAFLNKIINDPHYDDRHLRYCINRLGKIASPAALLLVLNKLYSMPQETQNFVHYMQRLPLSSITVEVVDSIILFLESEHNIYDWQMMWLLIFLARCNNVNSDHLGRLYRIEKLKTHFINRSIMSYVLCSKGGVHFQRIFMKKYREETSNEVKMAILCGIYRLEKTERNRFYESEKGDRQIFQLIQILKNKELRFI